MLHIGCHLSAAKGYYRMGAEALSIHADTLQFFTRNPRGASAKKVDPADIEKFAILLRENNFAPFVAHAPYTLNACSADEHIRELAKRMMAEDLQTLDLLGGNYYNFHPAAMLDRAPQPESALFATRSMRFCAKNRARRCF